MNAGLINGYLVLCLLLANLAFVTQRFLLIKSMHKSLFIRLVEWFLYAGIALTVGWGLEWQFTGSVKNQDWEFFVSTLFMFAIMAFPGFIWLQRRPKEVVAAEVNQ